MDEQKKLVLEAADKEIIQYYYLGIDSLALAELLNKLKLKLSDSQDIVPFNAQVKSYLGAIDQEGDAWIVKPVSSAEEMLFHRSSQLAFLLDHRTGTLAAPTAAVKIDGKPFRATKVVPHAMQISSYDYLKPPFLEILRADLINRWIFFDEDRNPNNYLVINNSKNKQFVVVIDYDKADMLSTSMKITGTQDKFGWQRAEKTRFLTLLKPDNFEGVSIDAFEGRLSSFNSISKKELADLASLCFRGYCNDEEKLVKDTVESLLKRRDYVNTYFRSIFKSKEETENTSHDEEYLLFGKSFMDMHKKNQ